MYVFDHEPPSFLLTRCLTKSNILIDENGHACLADFGLLTSVSEFLTTSGSPMMGGSVRWMSPELIDPEQFGLEDSRPTKESDCYAFGMVIYEVLSGQVPFASFRDFVVIRKVIEGEHPERPDGSKGAWFTDGIWEMLELCWKHLPSERISAETILLRLEGTPSPIRPDPNVQSCVTTPSDCGTFSRFRPRFNVQGLLPTTLVTEQVHRLRPV